MAETRAEEEYVAFVRSQPCAACGVDGACTPEGTIDPHHYMEHGGGMARKPSDYHTVPLCRRCHRAFHQCYVVPCYADHRREHAVLLTRLLFYRTQALLLAHWHEVF